MKRKSCSPPQLQLDDHRKHSRVSVPLMQFLDKSALAHIMCTSQGRVIGSKKMAEKAHRRVHCLPECIKSDDSRIKLCHASSLDRFSQAKSCHVIGDPLQAGWPLLRRCTTMNENRQMSVIEWALHLPDRPKENLNGQYCPWRVDECTTITKSNTMEVVKDIDSNTGMHTICNANTIPPRLELLIREKKSCHREFHLLELQAATSNFSTSKHTHTYIYFSDHQTNRCSLLVAMFVMPFSDNLQRIKCSSFFHSSLNTPSPLCSNHLLYANDVQESYLYVFSTCNLLLICKYSLPFI